MSVCIADIYSERTPLYTLFFKWGQDGTYLIVSNPARTVRVTRFVERKRVGEEAYLKGIVDDAIIEWARRMEMAVL